MRYLKFHIFCSIAMAAQPLTKTLLRPDPPGLFVMPPLPLCLNKSEEKNETSFGNNCLHTTNWLLHVIHNIAGEWTPLELAVQCSRTLFFLNNKPTDPTTRIKIRVSKSCNNSPHGIIVEYGLLLCTQTYQVLESCITNNTVYQLKIWGKYFED